MLDGESETHGHMHMCGDAHACIHGLITTNGRAPPPAYDRIRRVAARYRVRLTTAGVCTCMYVCSIRGCSVARRVHRIDRQRRGFRPVSVDEPGYAVYFSPCPEPRYGYIFMVDGGRGRGARGILKSHSNCTALRWYNR